jgi:hypothetical protein
MSTLLCTSKLLAIVFLFALLAPSDTLTITMSGIGSGNFRDQPFINAAFQFTFFTPDTANVTTAPCCAGVSTTPRGTSGSVTIAGVGTGVMDANGDQAIFVNPGAATAGIWHYNSNDFLTVTGQALSRYHLTETIAPVRGTASLYNNQITMSDRYTTLTFDSVSDVSFSVQRRPGGGTPGVVPLSPDSSTTSPNVRNIFTFTTSDTAGAGDLQGMNILLSDPPFSENFPYRVSDPYACWLWYQRSTRTLSLFVQDFIGFLSGSWPSRPLGPSGGTLTNSRCAVDTSAATVREAGTFLTLTLPIRLTIPEGNPQVYPVPMSIWMSAVNNENVDSGYQHGGQVTLNPTSQAGFAFYTTPTIQDVALGASATYKVNVVSWGGFNDVIAFSATVPMDNPKYTFDPPTVTGAGTTTLTVSSLPLVGKPYPGPTNAYYPIAVLGKSPSATFERAVGIAVETSPPAVSVRDYNPSGGPDHLYGFNVSGKGWWGDGVYSINGLNVLIAPALDGRNACWLFSDGKTLWLAGDDGITWSFAGPNPPTLAANSQCTVNGFGQGVDIVHFGWDLQAEIIFKPGFSALNNKMFVRASNAAGLPGIR